MAAKKTLKHLSKASRLVNEKRSALPFTSFVALHAFLLQLLWCLSLKETSRPAVKIAFFPKNFYKVKTLISGQLLMKMCKVEFICIESHFS